MVGDMDCGDQTVAFDAIEGLGSQKSRPTALALILLGIPLLASCFTPQVPHMTFAFCLLHLLARRICPKMETIAHRHLKDLKMASRDALLLVALRLVLRGIDVGSWTFVPLPQHLHKQLHPTGMAPA